MLDGQKPTTSDPVVPTATFSTAMLVELEASLCEHLGPISGLIVKRHARKTQTVEALLGALASEIDDTVARSVFEREARKIADSMPIG